MEIKTFKKAAKLQKQIKIVNRDLRSIEKLMNTERSPRISIEITDAETFTNFCFKGKRDWITAEILTMFKKDLETKLKSLQNEFDNL